MDKRCEMDNVRLAAVYRRFNKDPKVDINDPRELAEKYKCSCEIIATRKTQIKKGMV